MAKESIKDFAKASLQKLFGYENYLFAFSAFNIKRMQWTKYEETFQYFLSMIPKNGVILDIGANIGMMSTMLAKKFPESTIYSFEPIPSNNKAIKRVMRYFNIQNILLSEIAVGNTNGEIEMVLPVINNSKRQGISHVRESNNDEAWNNGEIFKVPIKRIDDLVDLWGNKPVSAIKLDVENYEFEVLNGAKKLIEQSKPIVYTELWANQNRTNCIDFFKALNYDVKIYENGHLIDFTDQNEINFYFIPKTYGK
ncbi:MAG: FkbM family methyltransferase [Bacteroidetes bacterium]|nr:FkbM family methyltransferase [Bacteroidota bacterium]